MNGLARIRIEDRVYSCQRFDPVNGMAFGAQLMSIASPALAGVIGTTDDGAKLVAALAPALPALMPLFRQALGQCFTPQGEPLADDEAINRYFMQYPGDMFVLGVQAMRILAQDYLPRSGVLAASTLEERPAPAIHCNA